jgi:membrane protease YdiL (CAAX protease family)
MTSPEVVGLSALGAYNLLQNLVVSDRAYVPANLAMTAGLIAFARRSGVSIEQMGLGRERLGEGVLLGGMTAAGAGLVTIAAARRFGRWFLDERARDHGPGEATYRALIRFPVGTALFEEVAFRGVLDALWRRRGDSFARVVTVLSFGVWHLLPTFRGYPGMGAGNGPSASMGERCLAAVFGAAATSLSGFAFTALRERAGHVAAPWLAHASINTWSYLAARRAWSMAGR